MVRRKSDDKRSQIIRVAADAFQELGYEGTSMLAIAERMRGSKQTLYNYFKSKEELLRAVLDFDVTEVTGLALEEFVAAKDLRKGLTRLGEIYLERQLAPLAISNLRIVSALPSGSEIGEDFYQNILCAAWKQVAATLKELMAKGQLRRADPWLAAMHFKGLALQDLLERQLLNARSRTEPKELKLAAKNAADAFLQIYGKQASAI